MRLHDLFTEAPLATRFFLRLRWSLTPYRAMAAVLPANGRILDVACGHGLLSFALVLDSPAREVLAIDHDASRVRMAQRASLRLPTGSRPVFEVGDVRKKLESVATGSVSAVAMIDTLHYFQPEVQRVLIRAAARVLPPGGILLVREIDDDAGIRAKLNRSYERVATGIGFTRSVEHQLTFRGKAGWMELLGSAGFKVRSDPFGPGFSADVLLIGQRNS